MSKCVDPVLCYTGQNTRKFRHFSLSSPTFKALHQTVYNCGKCIFCRKRKATELALRCVLHASIYKQNCFLTLTYDEKKDGYHNEFNYPDIQDFKKSLREFVSSGEYCDLRTKKIKRRRLPKEYRQKIEIFNVHEYGRNGKKHWHLVVFGWKPEDCRPFSGNGGFPLSTSRDLSKIWPHGFHTIGDVSLASAMYQAQYTQKDFQYSHAGTSRRSHSKHSGIARPYFERHYEQILRLGFVPFGGKKAPVPRYFLKLAHRHWCHFHDLTAFEVTKTRKEPLYRPLDNPSRHVSDCFDFYTSLRKEFIAELAFDWDQFIQQNLFSTAEAEFQLAGENAMHDLKNRFSKKEL